MKVPRRSSSHRSIVIALGAMLLVAVAVVIALRVLRPAPSSPEAPVTSAPPTSQPAPAPTRQLTFSAAGDFLAHDSVVQQAKTADGYDFSPYFSSVRPLYDKSDVFFCNVETPTAGPRYGISGYPAFNAPTEFARDMQKTGCNMINLANNHMADKGQGAINATLDTWAKLPTLAVAGANRSAEEQSKVAYFEKNGLKVAFVAFADFSNVAPPAPYSVNLYRDEALVRRLLTEARQQADAVIVSAHWGTEDAHEVNANQRSFVQLCAQLGVDVIIGTGPHVIQEVDMLKRPDGGQLLVWYSLGNFLSSQLQPDQLTGGVAQFRLSKEQDKLTISDIAFRPTFMSYEWSAADRQAQRLLARRNLTLQPLKDAARGTSLHGVSVDERMNKVRQWLGAKVPVTIE